MKLLRHVLLVGMMGAGKSVLGAELARHLNARHLDSDSEIERAAATSIPEIFARDGEPFFRDRERAVMARLLAEPPAVISTGGGAWVCAQTRRRAAERGALAVWLDVDFETLWSRVSARGGRPLLEAPNPREALGALLDARRADYAQADLRLAVNGDASVMNSIEALTRLLSTVQPPVWDATPSESAPTVTATATTGDLI